MAEEILEDRDGARVIEDLLHQVSPKMLEAVITNTVQHNLITDPTFRGEMYEMDNCAGSYIVTPVREDGGGFTAEEYQKVHDLGTFYLTSDFNAWTEEEWRNAATIDHAVCISYMEFDEVLKNMKETKKLALRFSDADLWLHDLKVRQFSTLSYVGSTIAMKMTTSRQDFFHNVKSSEKPLVFFASKFSSKLCNKTDVSRRHAISQCWDQT
jgi:hypothetical protein